jgi:hypothetical protein
MVVTRPPGVVKIAVAKSASSPKTGTKQEKAKEVTAGTEQARRSRVVEEGNLCAARLMG